MSIYFKDRVKELAEKKMREDLNEIGHLENDERFKSEEYYKKFFTLSDEEFDKYFLLMHIVKDINKWHFCLTDDLYDIIDENEELSQAFKYDLSIDECMEMAKDEDMIDGFIELGGDLWMIKGWY